MAFWICLSIALLVAGVAWRARGVMGWGAGTFLVAAGILAALAAGGLRIPWSASGRFTVLVDLSDSTRGADYRDSSHLRQRLGRILGDQTYDIREFGNEGPPPVDRPAILFSDGRLAGWRSSQPTWPVVDPSLAKAQDARVVEVRQERGNAIAIVENSGQERSAKIDERAVPIPSGKTRILLGTAAQSHRIAIDTGDLWPENDSGDALQWPGRTSARWTVGVAPLASNGLKMASELPDNPAGYLSTSLLAIDAASAATLRLQQEQALATWVRDMGGAMILVAGDASWSRLRGSMTDKISPLSVDPPEPAAQWVVLLDFSGSMASAVGDVPKWQRCVDAAAALVRTLPERDTVRLGSFAEQLRWWSDAPAGQINVQTPVDVRAHGPTNLRSAFEGIAGAQGSPRREIVLLTDAEVELPNAEDLQKQLKASGTRVHCLLLSDGRGAAMLEQLCRATGGMLLPEREPQRWPDAARRLASDLAPTRWNLSPVEATTGRPLPEGTARIAGWNSAWIRNGAVAFASSGERVLAAQWQIEMGHVATLAWAATREQLLAVADAIERQPANPAYSVKWPGMSDRRIAVDVDLSAARDLRNVAVRVAPAGNQAVRTVDLRESAPGRYEGEVKGAEGGAYLTVMADGVAVARGALPPTYGGEFAGIGIDREQLTRIATQSGGKVIEGDEVVDVRRQQRWVDLRTWAGLFAATCLAGAILLIRRKI